MYSYRCKLGLLCDTEDGSDIFLPNVISRRSFSSNFPSTRNSITTTSPYTVQLRFAVLETTYMSARILQNLIYVYIVLFHLKLAFLKTFWLQSYSAHNDWSMSIIPSNYGHFLFRDVFDLRLVLIANRLLVLVNVAQFKYFETTVTNQNLIQKEIKRRLNSSNACYSVQKILSSHLLSKNIKIRLYKIIIFIAILYGCETWYLT
jgi:hypothetical protein